MKPQASAGCVHLSTEVAPARNLLERQKQESVLAALNIGASPIWLFAAVTPDMIMVVA